MIVSKNEQIQQLQSMIDTNEERMNELESKLKRMPCMHACMLYFIINLLFVILELQTTVADKDTQIEELEAQIAIFPTHVPG